MNKQKQQKNIENEILQKISDENLKPKPKWEFLLKNIYFWTLGIITVILGGLSVSATIFVFKNIRWEFYNMTHNNIFTFTIEFIPYLWILLLIIFLFFGHNLIRKTKHGYKYNILIIAGISILSSIILGFIFTTIGFGQIIDRDLGNRIPFHKGVEVHNKMIWDKPSDGLMVGQIKSIEDNLFIISPKGENINLLTEHLDDNELEILNQNKEIRIIGIKKEGGFYICHIIPDLRNIKEGLPIKMFKKEFERKSGEERSKECEDVRPYKKLLYN